MKPANHRQAVFGALQLMREQVRSLAPQTRRRELARVEQFALALWVRWKVGLRSIRCKHVRWYLEVAIAGDQPSTQYSHWLSVRRVVRALGHGDWEPRLHGQWCARHSACVDPKGPLMGG